MILTNCFSLKYFSPQLIPMVRNLLGLFYPSHPQSSPHISDVTCFILHKHEKFITVIYAMSKGVFSVGVTYHSLKGGNLS